MSIGDRDHRIGSLVKGHQRFGGFQKQNQHGRNTPTIIANEYNSLFCFNKLSALAIVLAGFDYLLFGLTFSCFDETSTRTSSTILQFSPRFSAQETTNGLAYRW